MYLLPCSNKSLGSCGADILKLRSGPARLYPYGCLIQAGVLHWASPSVRVIAVWVFDAPALGGFPHTESRDPAAGSSLGRVIMTGALYWWGYSHYTSTRPTRIAPSLKRKREKKKKEKKNGQLHTCNFGLWEEWWKVTLTSSARVPKKIRWP